MIILYSIVLLLGIKVTEGAKSQSAFDNAIIGQPYISCQRDRIVIEVITERLFTGKVFVKGDYANPQCTKTFRNGVVSNENISVDSVAFLGTVTKSRESYAENQIKSQNDLEKLKLKSETNHELNPDLLNPESFGIHKNNINLPPDISESYLLPQRNETTSIEAEKGEWKGVGGVSADGNFVISGTRGEEVRITQAAPKSRQGTTGTTSSSLSPECPPPTTCEPCVCEERRSRRATNSIRLEVPLSSCNTKRDRKLNPPSVVVSLIAVVSFHDSFITKLDKAYHIQCAYAESQKTVSTDLDVNMADEQEINGTVEPPSCDYLISDGNGNSVQNSLVGELVRHQWTCKGGMASKLKMLVHQCYVKDGAGQQFEVIDEHGCTLDHLMLQTPTYSGDGMTAQVDAYIFKFPDRSTVDFRCTITFCSVDDAECQDMTPPKCDSTNNLLRRKRSLMQHGLSSMSLHANSLTVFDIDSKTDSSQLLPTPSSLRKTLKEYERSFCVSVASFGILISASTFFATISLSVIFSYIFLRFNHKFSIDR